MCIIMISINETKQTTKEKMESVYAARNIIRQLYKKYLETNFLLSIPMVPQRNMLMKLIKC